MRGGEVIQRARRWAHLSVDDLAARLDVAPSVIAAWESGDPAFAVVQQAVEACDQNLAQVVSEPEPDPHDLALLDETLRLTVDQRLQRLKHYVRFIEAGRSAMREARAAR
jgi:hypothetical protein